MKIIIDADGCPVLKIATAVGLKYNLDIIIVSDTCHLFDFENPKISVVVADKGFDSADFLIINKACKNDIVVTQDYALATMCLAKNCFPINQNGYLYTDKNIDELLLRRHIGKKLKKSGKYSSKIKKRTASDNELFQKELIRVIEKIKSSNI